MTELSLAAAAFDRRMREFPNVPPVHAARAVASEYGLTASAVLGAWLRR